MFMCSCSHIVKWQRLKTAQVLRALQYVCSNFNNKTMRLRHSFTETHTTYKSF